MPGYYSTGDLAQSVKQGQAASPINPNPLGAYMDYLQKQPNPAKMNPYLMSSQVDAPKYFLKNQTKAVYVPVDQPSGGKWICSMVLKKKIISDAQFNKLVLGHFAALFLDPNFAYWYLIVGKKLVERAEADHFNWAKFPIQSLQFIYDTQGIKAAIHYYKNFCFALFEQYGAGLKSPEIKGGAIKMLQTKWLCRALPRFASLQLKGNK